MQSNCVDSAEHSQEGLTPEQFTQDFDYVWSELRENYAYFDRKETDWNRVREVYRPKVAEVKSMSEFITLLERVLDELYDPHTHLKVNTNRSTRLIPTGLDFWAEWKDGKATITQLRKGFSAEQAGLKIGMEIISINGVPVEAAIHNRLGVTLRKTNEAARSWALRALLAGSRDTRRIIEAKSANGVKATFQPDLPTHTTVDNYYVGQKVEWGLRQDEIGYIKINDLGSDDTVTEIDAALEQLKPTRGLIIDLRATQSGGNTSVAEPIMGRFIERRMPYQRGVPMHGAGWTREVSPRGTWRYKAPVVVLVGRWTAIYPPTYFEMVTAMAFLHFSGRTRLAVLEVGLGGRLDATNIVRQKVSVITSIGLDHEQFLGTTLEEIAAEKAGIIKGGEPVVVGPAVEYAVVSERAGRHLIATRDVWRQARPLGGGYFELDVRTPVREYKSLRPALAGRHQLENAVVAIRAAECLELGEEAIRDGIDSAAWPGRLQRVGDRPGFFLEDRGRIAPGMAADLVIFDPASVGMAGRAERLHDLPGGGKRMVKRSSGVEYTLVNGEVLWERGKLTGAAAGKVLRS